MIFLNLEDTKIIDDVAIKRTRIGRSYSGRDLSGEYIDPHSWGGGTLESESIFSPGGQVEVTDLSK